MDGISVMFISKQSGIHLHSAYMRCINT